VLGVMVDVSVCFSVSVGTSVNGSTRLEGSSFDLMLRSASDPVTEMVGGEGVGGGAVSNPVTAMVVGEGIGGEVVRMGGGGSSTGVVELLTARNSSVSAEFQLVNTS
jgi:hypothetical protein